VLRAAEVSTRFAFAAAEFRGRSAPSALHSRLLWRLSRSPLHGRLRRGATVLACGGSFWAGQYTAPRAASATATPNAGPPPMSDPVPTQRSSEDEPACSLTPAQLKAQRQQLIPGLFQRAEMVEDIPNGIRFRFAHQPKLVTELAVLIEKERVCCSFLSFRLVTEKGQGPIALEVTGPAGTAEMLRKL
jgi:hypothetical protein